MKKSVNFKDDRIFSYDRFGKVLFGLIMILLGVFIVLLIVSYFFLKDSDIFLFILINAMIKYFSTHIMGATLLGAFYTTAIGGFFIFAIPLEILFLKFLKAGHPFLFIFVLYFLGLIISFTLNYLVGLKLAGLSKKLVSPKKFYKIKGMLNKWGALTILLFNATPLPAQLLAVILGAFRYNKTRFYVFFLLGQLVKYVAIAVFYYYF
ncbi:hypothetical protein KY331_02580 [Candidatus Woesearchaeota archaeon]|nr:hypothetical protein [Candidatus Woesearchaeota archaeon]